MRYGIKSVTMDDLARHLAVSKKTLYKFVENKADLVKKVMQEVLTADKELAINIAAEAKNAIQALYEMGEHSSRQFEEMNPAAVFDLQKYYPQSWTMVRKHHDEFFYELLLKNVTRGRKEGLYRENFEEELVCRFFCMHMETGHEFLAIHKQFTFGNLIETHMSYHLHGIATKKGLTELNRILKKKRAV